MRRLTAVLAAMVLAFLPLGSAQSAQAAQSAPPLPGFAISILPGSTIHLLSHNSKLPISIQNNYPVEIRVQVHVSANSLNALFPSVVEVTVPANTTYVAQVPIEAIADGNVSLKAWLTTFSGLSMGDPVDLNLTINAEVEESLIGGFAFVVVGLVIIGVIRTVRKKRANVPA